MLTNSHVQSTATIWPNSQVLKEYLCMPLAVSLQPFTHDQPLGSIIPDEINTYRCQSCKAFFNQLCFIRNEHEYDCSICGCTNQLQQEIKLDMPELNNLSYKLKAPQKQRILTTNQRLVVFAIDLSNYGEQSKQYLLYAIPIIKEFIKTANRNNIPLNIMIIGFDSGIHRFIINQEKLKKIVTNTDQDPDEQYFPQYKRMIGTVAQHYQNIMQVLDGIQHIAQNKTLRNGNSKAIMQTIKLSLRASEGYSGKIFLVSGIRHQLKQFQQKLKKYSLDVLQKHNYLTNKKQCITPDLEKLLQTTQMSISISFINNHYMNSMPFHYIAKQLNGELRHYFPTQLKLFFQDFKDNVEQILSQNTVFQSLMRVRYSTGLKLVGIFGTFRQTKVADQIQFLTCPYNRRFMFEFLIEGRITSQLVIMQFSSLFTDLKGERYFIIQTQAIKVSDNMQVIIPSINYSNINVSYVRGIIHNLDSAIKIRNLQLTMQQRCKKHLKAVRQSMKIADDMSSQNLFDCQPLKKAKPYIVLTFLMMKHFLLNQIYPNAINFDLNAQLRSKIATVQNSLNIIWPIVYAINEHGWEVIEMRQKYHPKATVAIFIDRCDQHYAYLSNPALQAELKTANGKQNLYRLIETERSLSKLKQLIQEFKNNKQIEYMDILPLEELNQLKILDMEGQFGFDRFINQLLKA